AALAPGLEEGDGGIEVHLAVRGHGGHRGFGGGLLGRRRRLVGRGGGGLLRSGRRRRGRLLREGGGSDAENQNGGADQHACVTSRERKSTSLRPGQRFRPHVRVRSWR